MSTETVRVRVFVSVAPDGVWAAKGCSVYSDATSIRETDHSSTVDAGYWIEADLPIPVKDESPGYNVKVTKAD